MTASYGADPAVVGIDVVASPGDAVALIGPNGAGKSTVLKAILGLVPVVSGAIEVLGRAPKQARGLVAYVPQAESLDPEFPVSAHQVVLMGRYRRIGWLRRPRRHDYAVADDALARVGMTDRAGATFGVLSGGQRQRVLIARAIAQEAQILLLDEPFNGLDSPTTDLLLAVLDELRAAGATVVMSTHDLDIARRACNRACVLNRGQVAFGPTTEVLILENLRRAYAPDAGEAELLVDTHHGHGRSHG